MTRPPALPGRDRSTRRASARPGAGAFGDLASAGLLRSVAIDAIVANPDQPRQHFDQQRLQALAASIAERGVLQPPVVRDLADGRYELVMGERRWRAARLAGRTEIDVLIGDHDRSASLQDALIENVAREDLSPVELARAYATLIEDLGITQQQLAERTTQGRVTIANHLRLLNLPDAVLELLDTRQLTFAHGRALLQCEARERQLALARQAVRDGWSTRQLEQACRPPAARRPAPRGVNADAAAFAERFATAVSVATGLDVRARAGADGALTVTVADHASAIELAQRLGAPLTALEEPEAPRVRDED